MSISQIKTSSAIKATHVICGQNIIDMTSQNEVKIASSQGSSVYINPITKKTDLLFDVTQLNGKTINNITITELQTSSIVYHSMELIPIILKDRDFIDQYFSYDQESNSLTITIPLKGQTVDDIYQQISLILQTLFEYNIMIHANEQKLLDHDAKFLVIDQKFVDYDALIKIINQSLLDHGVQIQSINLQITDLQNKNILQDQTFNDYKITTNQYLQELFNKHDSQDDDIKEIRKNLNSIEVGFGVFTTITFVALQAQVGVLDGAVVSLQGEVATLQGQIAINKTAQEAKDLLQDEVSSNLFGDTTELKLETATLKTEAVTTKTQLSTNTIQISANTTQLALLVADFATQTIWNGVQQAQLKKVTDLIKNIDDKDVDGNTIPLSQIYFNLPVRFSNGKTIDDLGGSTVDLTTLNSKTQWITIDADYFKTSKRLMTPNFNTNSRIQIGNSSLYSLTTGTNNFGIGTSTLFSLTTGCDNLCLGNNVAVMCKNDIEQNIIIGINSAQNLQGSMNLIIGQSTFNLQNQAYNNIILGAYSCNMNGTFNHGIYLGNFQTPYSSSVTNEIIIGNGSKEGDNVTVLVGKGSDTCLIKGKLYTTENNIALQDQLNNHDSLIQFLSERYNFILDTSGKNNLQLGYLTFNYNIAGADNTGIGFSALRYISSGNKNTCVGSQCGTWITTGVQNTLQGCMCMPSIKTGSNNTIIGAKSGPDMNEGGSNTCVGSFSLRRATRCNECTTVGCAALPEALIPTSCVALGYFSGGTTTTGSNNLYLGNYTASLSQNTQFETVIGCGVFQGNVIGKGSNTCFIKGKLYTSENSIALQDQINTINNIVKFDAAKYNMTLGYNGTLTSNGYNVIIGQETMKLLVNGFNNVGIGAKSLTALTSSLNSIVLGSSTATNITLLQSSVIIASSSQTTQTSLYGAINIGAFNETNNYSTTIGQYITSLNENEIIIGSGASGTQLNGKGLGTALIACDKLYTNGNDVDIQTQINQKGIKEDIYYNCHLGTQTLMNKTADTKSNCVFGYQAGQVITGINNVCFGNKSLHLLTTGQGNIGLGIYSGGGTNMQNSLYIGNYTQASKNDANNEIVIGAGLTGKGDNTILVKGKLYTTENVIALQDQITSLQTTVNNVVTILRSHGWL